MVDGKVKDQIVVVVKMTSFFRKGENSLGEGD